MLTNRSVQNVHVLMAGTIVRYLDLLSQSLDSMYDRPPSAEATARWRTLPSWVLWDPCGWTAVNPWIDRHRGKIRTWAPLWLFDSRDAFGGIPSDQSATHCVNDLSRSWIWYWGDRQSSL